MKKTLRETSYQMTKKESQELGDALLNIPLNEWKLYGGPIEGWGGNGRASTLYRKALIEVERICEKRIYTQDHPKAYYDLSVKTHGFSAISSSEEGFGGIEEKLYEHIVKLRRTEIEQLKEQRRRELQEKFKKIIKCT